MEHDIATYEGRGFDEAAPLGGLRVHSPPLAFVDGTHRDVEIKRRSAAVDMPRIGCSKITYTNIGTYRYGLYIVMACT